MSQEQPRRPQGSQDDQAITYGDMFNVEGELASQKIAPRDAAAMQSAETRALGGVQKGGPAAVMQSAAEHNEAIGAVKHDEASQMAGQHGVTIAQGMASGRRVIAEAVGRKVIGGYADVTHARRGEEEGAGRPETEKAEDRYPSQITIGEALEAAALVGGDKPVDKSDAAAVQAAEIRATGRGHAVPGGVAAKAQSAADLNPFSPGDAGKTRLSEVIGAATDKLPSDKAASMEDAERVVAAELRNDPRAEGPRPGGVASAVAAAARINARAKTP